MKYETKDGQSFELTGLPPHAEGKALTLHDVDGSNIEVAPVTDAPINERPFLDKLEGTPVTESVEFWMNFPIDLRPLKFIPGRNRREKRTFQKLAGQAERGTISKGHPKGGGGNLKRLRGMLQLFQSLGIAKMAPEKKS